MSVAADLYSGLIGAVLGSVVGSGIGAYATWRVAKWQVERTVKAGTEQYRMAAEDERARAREAAREERALDRRRLGMSAAADALGALALLHRAVPHLRARGHIFGRPGSDVASALRDHALDELRRVQLALLPLLGDRELSLRWDRLLALAREYSTLRQSSPSEETVDVDEEGNAVLPVDEALVGRAQQDLEEYLDYVQTSVAVWIRDEPLPPPIDPPVLRRRDGAVWRWRTMPAPAAWAQRAQEA